MAEGLLKTPEYDVTAASKVSPVATYDAQKTSNPDGSAPAYEPTRGDSTDKKEFDSPLLGGADNAIDIPKPDTGGLLGDQAFDGTLSTEYVSPKYDSKASLDAQVEDINYLTSQDNPLMKAAETTGKQFANERGLLSSSMAAGAVEAERLNTVMPLVQQNAQIRGQFDLTNLDTSSRERLIGVEQEWNRVIQRDVNAAAFWQTSIDGYLDVLNNKDLTPEQMSAARDELFGWSETLDDGSVVEHEGTVYASLDFMDKLTGGTGFIDQGQSGDVPPGPTGREFSAPISYIPSDMSTEDYELMAIASMYADGSIPTNQSTGENNPKAADVRARYAELGFSDGATNPVEMDARTSQIYEDLKGGAIDWGDKKGRYWAFNYNAPAR